MKGMYNEICNWDYLTCIDNIQWRSLGLFSSEAFARGVRKLKKKWAIETHFPEFKWI